jgi:hypothetical protein
VTLSSATVGPAMLEEQNLVYYVIAGGVLILLAYLWCLRRAFDKGFLWGVLALIPPFFLLWALSASPHPDGKRRGGKGPVVLTLLGLVLISSVFALNSYRAAFPDLSPHEEMVDGKLNITLTGWDQTDYSFLDGKKRVVVLQMANPDVTNETLKHLEGMNDLEVLDLDKSQVDDDGLATLAALPKLRELRLAKTKVTDEGFSRYLAGKESLLKLDLTGTSVKTKLLRDWKNAKPGRDYLR